MLKNVSPIVSGALLRALDETPSGAWIAVVSRDHHATVGIRAQEAIVEEVVMALLTVTPLDRDSPIVFEGDTELDDIGYAVLGLASDAEDFRFSTLQVTKPAFSALLAQSKVTVLVDSETPFGFLLCKGYC